MIDDAFSYSVLYIPSKLKMQDFLQRLINALLNATFVF